MKKITVGDYKCYSLSDGYFKLDGGAMFGIVPKTIWGRLYESDAFNRIRLGLTSLLIKGKGITLLVEGGIGQVFNDNEKLKNIYAVEKADFLEEDLLNAGYKAADITHVFYSHLHWDHAGTACRLANDKFVPRFPKAEYLVQKGEWDIAVSGHPRTEGSYIAGSLLPVLHCGSLKPVVGDYKINEDIEIKVTGGHTAFHMILLLKSGGDNLIFWGDLLPTSKHIHVPHIMAYDLFPEDTYRVKKNLLKMVYEENFISVFPHDEPGFGRIGFDGERYFLKEEVSE